jgi:hypothetical protein
MKASVEMFVSSSHTSIFSNLDRGGAAIGDDYGTMYGT